jgi:heptosyltransferase III
MRRRQDILSLVQAKDAQVARESRRAVILQPGALGDCILTLPLAATMKQTLNLGGVDIIGHAEYIAFLPGRSCVDSIRSIDATDLHRLFVEAAKFDLGDRDPLIGMLADYAWIVNFLGDANSDFEQNLMYTAYCSHSAEVFSVPLKPPDEWSSHVAEYYVGRFADQAGLPPPKRKVAFKRPLIRPTRSDRSLGRQWLNQAGLDSHRRLAVVHPGSGGRHKCWHAKNFVAIAESLRRMAFEVLFLLGPAEMERFSGDDIHRLRQTGHCAADLALAQVVSILCCAKAFVGNDSGVTHLAAAMGLHTVALFGPTDPARYSPIGPAVKVVRDPRECFAREPCPDVQETVLEALTALVSS